MKQIVQWTPTDWISDGKVRACFTFLILVLLLAGCALPQNHAMVANGPGTDFVPDDLDQYRQEQERTLQHLYGLAGLVPADRPPRSEQDWWKVIQAGLEYSDARCERYLHALFRLQRDKSSAVAQIGILGAASASVLNALKASARDLALTAVAFGVAAGTVENMSGNVLYALEPSSVRAVVHSLQKGFRDSLQRGYDTRPAALAVIRAYHRICLPSNIEAEVNLVVRKTPPEVSKGDPKTGEPPSSTHAALVSTSFTFGNEDKYGDLIADFLKKDTTKHRLNTKKLLEFLEKNGLSTDLNTLMLQPERATDREKVVDYFLLK